MLLGAPPGWSRFSGGRSPKDSAMSIGYPRLKKGSAGICFTTESSTHLDYLEHEDYFSEDSELIAVDRHSAFNQKFAPSQ